MIERISPTACAVLAILSGSALMGCGLKGSLYLPEEKAQEVSSQSATSDEEKKQRSNSDRASELGTTPAAPIDTTDAPAPTSPAPGN